MNWIKAKMSLTLCAFTGLQIALYAEGPIQENRDEQKRAIHVYEDELIVVDRVITLLELQQKDQRQLKILIAELRHNQELFMKGDQTKYHAKLMLKAARQSLAIINKYHLRHLFSSEFLEELAVLSQIGNSLEVLYE